MSHLTLDRDTDLNNQREKHALSRAMSTILGWHSFWDPRILLNPLRPPIQGYYSRQIHSFIRGELQKRLEELHSETNSIEKTNNQTPPSRSSP